MVERVKRFLIHFFMKLCRIFPVDRNKVVILSYYGRGFGDHGKGIALALLQKKPNMDIVWAAFEEHRTSIPAPIRFVAYCSLRYYWEMATAGVWIDNARKGIELCKRKEQFYIQFIK